MNRAHWPTKENRQNSIIFSIFSAHGKIASNGPKWGQELFFPASADLANILGDTDVDFENFYFFDLLDPNILNFQVPKSQNFWISRSPDLQNLAWARLGTGRSWAGWAFRRAGCAV